MNDYKFDNRPSETNKKKRYVNAVGVHIAAFLFDLEQDWIVNREQSFIFKYFQKKNTSNKNAIKKKVQDFFYNNWNARCRSVTIDMLIEYCEEYNTTPNDVLEYRVKEIGFHNFYDILPNDKCIFPLKIDFLTGTILWIRIDSGHQYLTGSYDIEEIVNAKGNEITGAEVFVFNDYEQANESFKDLIRTSSDQYRHCNKIIDVTSVPKEFKKYVAHSIIQEIGASVENTIDSAKERANSDTKVAHIYDEI